MTNVRIDDRTGHDAGGSLLRGPPDRLRRDHHNPLPLYVQVREALRRDIRDRGLEAGDRIPTEAALEHHYGVSRSTIRQAVGELEAEGVLTRVQGRGTFVGRGTIRHPPVLTSFSELLRSQGYDPSHELLESGIVKAPGSIAQTLEVPSGTECRRLRRRFFADDDPVGLSTTWLPLTLLGEHDRTLVERVAGGGSLYQELVEADPALAPYRATETVDAVDAQPDEAALLHREPASALLLIHRTSRTATDRPVEWSRLLFVPGRYGYHTELQRPA